MTTDVLFIIRKEDTDNKYKIVDEVETGLVIALKNKY